MFALGLVLNCRHGRASTWRRWRRTVALVTGGALRFVYARVPELSGGIGDVKLAAAGAPFLLWTTLPLALVLAATAGVRDRENACGGPPRTSCSGPSSRPRSELSFLLERLGRGRPRRQATPFPPTISALHSKQRANCGRAPCRCDGMPDRSRDSLGGARAVGRAGAAGDLRRNAADLALTDLTDGLLAHRPFEQRRTAIGVLRDRAGRAYRPGPWRERRPTAVS